MNYVLFDDLAIANFFPITLTRSTGDLRVGILKLRQRISAYFELTDCNYIIPDFLEKLYKERHPDWSINAVEEGESVFVNSRVRIDESFCKKVQNMALGSLLYVEDGSVLAVKMKTRKQNCSSEKLLELFANVSNMEQVDVCLWNNLWEMINENSRYIEEDFATFFYEKDQAALTEVGVTALNPYHIWIGEGVVIKPGVVLDASEGPIVIDEGAKILANSVITGPVYIGKKSVIKALSKIYEGTSIGPVCKIGGEVEETIIQAYSNKQHEGFLGHSYLGEWVNLGADTNNSDLKNNYKQVKSFFYPKAKEIDTGFQFLGAVIGDHVKTGINSTINTGSVLGVGCNLFGKEVISGFVSSFQWGEMGHFFEYRLDKFFETAELVKRRRNLLLSETEKELFTEIKKTE